MDNIPELKVFPTLICCILCLNQHGIHTKDTPSELLRKTRDALLDRYPQTTIKVDRLVVDVFFGNFTFEVQPVYEERDGGRN